MIWVYRLIYFLLKCVFLLLKPVLSPHLQQWIDLRSKQSQSEKDIKGAYWFHASSGEIEYGKSVMRRLKEAAPAAKIVVTYSSPSAEKLFGNISGFVDEFIPITWDEPAALSQLFDRIQPAYLLFSRTDLWPEFIYQAKKRNVPMGIFSFNPKYNFVSRITYKTFLKYFTFVSCVDELSAESLKEILPGLQVSGDGDTRFDQVFFRLSQEPKVSLKNFSQLCVFGSTWPQDEIVVLNCLPWLKARNMKLILSPHDVNDYNVQRLQSEVRQRNFTYQVLSDSLRAGHYDISLDSDVLLIDKIGYLADCYRYADFAFVGGSFKDKVHSVMEPLCCGLKVAVGPYFKNSPESVKYLNRFVFSAQSTDEMLKVFEKISTSDKSTVVFEMRKNLNASQKILELIQRMPVKS